MKTGFFFRILILLGLFGIIYPLQSQDSNPLALEDIYKNSIYGQDGYGPVRWMKDNKGYSTLEFNEETNGQDIVRYDAKSCTSRNASSVSVRIFVSAMDSVSPTQTVFVF